MAKRGLSAVAGFLSVCLPLFAQQTDSPGVFAGLNNSVLRLQSLTLLDGSLFSFSEAVAPSLVFNWMEAPPPEVFLPALIVTQSRRVATVSPARIKDSSKEIVEVQRSNPFDYAHGEVGFLYGVSSGKYGGNFEQGYITGEVGNERMQISAGASFEHSNERFPRFGR